MHRRHFLKASLSSGTAAVAAAVAPPGVAASTAVHRWRLVMAVPKTLPVWGPGVQRFAEHVNAMSEGRLQISVYGGGELVPALEAFDAVSAGHVEMGHSASYYWQGKMPAAPFFTAVPFGLNADGMRAWLIGGGGQNLWDELYAPHGLMALPAGNTGLQMGGWFRKEIQSVADFKGLKMRIPGLGGKVLNKLGGQPMLVAGSEIFTNLSTGVLDAAEWVGPYHDFVMGFYKVAKYYYHPGWQEPGPVLELLINIRAWNRLSPALQAIVRAAAAQLDRDMHAEWQAKDSEYLARIRNEGLAVVRPFPDEVLRDLRTAAESVKRDVAATSGLAQRIYDSQRLFQERYEQYQAATEWDYVRALGKASCQETSR